MPQPTPALGEGPNCTGCSWVRWVLDRIGIGIQARVLVLIYGLILDVGVFRLLDFVVLDLGVVSWFVCIVGCRILVMVQLRFFSGEMGTEDVDIVSRGNNKTNHNIGRRLVLAMTVGSAPWWRGIKVWRVF